MSEVYAFGPFVLDVERRVVTRKGVPIALPPKAFELLRVLVTSGGRALSRDALLAALAGHARRGVQFQFSDLVASWSARDGTGAPLTDGGAGCHES